jgi:sulfopyruvate decarboxylase subunit alpha
MDAKPEQAKVELHGSKIIAAIRDAGVEFVLAVPDIHTSKGLLFPIADDPKLKLIRVCKEHECTGIASCLHYTNRRSLTLIQYTGFLDSLNAIRAVAVEYKQPICMMVGLLGHEAERAPNDSGRYGVRIIQPILRRRRANGRHKHGTSGVSKPFRRLLVAMHPYA